MEDSTTRKRLIQTPSIKREQKYKIYEEVFILSCLRDSMPKICDALSVSIRTAILVDLALENSLTFTNNKLHFTTYNGQDVLLENVFKQIMNTEMTPKELLKAINGENYLSFTFNLHIKKLRHKISKKLECDGKISFAKNRFKFFKGKVSVNPNVKKELIDDIVNYIGSGESDLHKLGVLICLKYCGGMSGVFFSLPPSLVADLNRKVNEIENRFRVEYNGEGDRTVFEILRALVTL